MTAEEASAKALALLRKHWGYDAFRPMQQEIIVSVLLGHDTLGLLPTGGGKSITFQVPALALDGLTVVVTPLISLMKDQVDNLRRIGVRAIYFHSGLTARENRLALDRCRLGKVKIVYVSPEKLRTESFIDNLRHMTVRLIVVDEAHCISQWGYDFRPSYLRIAELRGLFPDVPVLALTASATPEVVDDIMTRLEFRARNLYARSFTRDNLSYIVRYADFKDDRLMRVLTNTSGSAIVYVRSRRRTREIAEMLTSRGISAASYHAGLTPEDKNERQNLWKEGRIRVMVATNAFGMGIDKPDVRTVIHMDVPPSLEEYYQEAGRAGRDGLPAFAVLIASKTDKAMLTRRLSEAFPPKDQIRRVYELVGNFLDVAVGSGFGHLYEFNFEKFCLTYGLQPAPTRAALLILTRAGYIEYVDEVATRSRLMVVLDKNELYALRLDPTTDRVMQSALRSYTGLFADYQQIDERSLAMHLGVSEEAVYQSMLTLRRIGAVSYIPRKSTPYILYTTSREEPRYVTLPLEVYECQRERMARRIDAMKRFVFRADDCRVNTMLRYFGETPRDVCHKCDVCREHLRTERQRSASNDDGRPSLEESVIYLASQPGGHTVEYMCRQTASTPECVIETVRSLADRGVVTLDGLNVSLRR